MESRDRDERLFEWVVLSSWVSLPRLVVVALITMLSHLCPRWQCVAAASLPHRLLFECREFVNSLVDTPSNEVTITLTKTSLLTCRCDQMADESIG